jgi:hypothetical protein
MHPELSHLLAATRQQELRTAAKRARRFERRRRDSAPTVVWQGLTLRLATAADHGALARLAELEESPRPAGPILLGELMQRPVAALSLCDGSVIADPFTATADVVELMRMRARQLARR